jgi:hypothetical protein
MIKNDQILTEREIERKRISDKNKSKFSNPGCNVKK